MAEGGGAAPADAGLLFDPLAAPSASLAPPAAAGANAAARGKHARSHTFHAGPMAAAPAAGVASSAKEAPAAFNPFDVIDEALGSQRQPPQGADATRDAANPFDDQPEDVFAELAQQMSEASKAGARLAVPDASPRRAAAAGAAPHTPPPQRDRPQGQTRTPRKNSDNAAGGDPRSPRSVGSDDEGEAKSTQLRLNKMRAEQIVHARRPSVAVPAEAPDKSGSPRGPVPPPHPPPPPPVALGVAPLPPSYPPALPRHQRAQTYTGGPLAPQAAAAQPPPVPAAPTSVEVEVDALPMMRRGTPFLKYGKHGYPHFRIFQLSDDNQRIFWFSKNKKLSETIVHLNEVNEILEGQQTANFGKQRTPELESCSFSLVYERSRKTLDLIAKDINEYRVWIAGLRELLHVGKAQGWERVSELRTLKVRVRVRRGRPSGVALLQSVGFHLDPVLDDPERARSETAIPVNADEVSAAFEDLKAEYQALRDRVNSKHYFNSPYYNQMMIILDSVQQAISTARTHITQGRFSRADDDVWRAGVELESLDNMLGALK